MISKKKKTGHRRNPTAYSGRNHKLKRFFRPTSGDLQKKKNEKGLRRNPKAFSGRNQKFKRFFRPKTATFSSPKKPWGARNKSGGGQKRKLPPRWQRAWLCRKTLIENKQNAVTFDILFLFGNPGKFLREKALLRGI